MKIERTEKLPRYKIIESIVELEIQDDDVNKENETDEERKRYKTSFKNTKLPVTNEDLEDITNKRILSDNVIQDPLLDQTSQYSVIKKSEICANFA